MEEIQHNVLELVDVEGYRRANEYLALGWRFVRSYVTNSPNSPHDDRNETPHFVLAWIGRRPISGFASEAETEKAKPPHPLEGEM